ncbi:hypothetical protein MPSEU_000202800 [Mayamaea pseudoterrestris]|nr:hypothetical protein MPSEU_000202800 [Mayamaea pseudoterrestris]
MSDKPMKGAFYRKADNHTDLYLPCCGVDDDDSSFDDAARSSTGDSSDAESEQEQRSRKTIPQTKKRKVSKVGSKSAESSVRSSDRTSTRRSKNFTVPKQAKHTNTHIFHKRSIPIRKAADKAKKTKWTECIAVAHIIQDEARRYFEESDDSLDPMVLAEWTGRVTKALVQQNTHVVDNLEAVTAAKVSETRVAMLRKEIAKAEAHVRLCTSEHDKLQERIEVQLVYNTNVRGASRLLKYIEKLSK